MKEFVDKLIERLEEKIDGNKKYTSSPMGNDARNQIIGLKKAIEIVNQVASEYCGGTTDDLISRRALIGKLEKWKFANEERGYDTAKDLVQEMIELTKEQETVGGNVGWIPCSERLPEIEADVLLSLRSLDVYTGFRANTEGSFYVEGEGYVEFENVIAWQPLPQPYKENENE